MRWHLRIILSMAVLTSLPTMLRAQSDICQPSAPSVPDTSKAELYRIQTEDRVARDAERRDWQVTTIALKNAVTEYSLRQLCIFRIEIAPQTGRVLLIRAPKDTAMMDAIKEAIKAIDVPPPAPVPPKSVELTAYVLAALDGADSTLKPVPQSLQPVVNQLKSLLPNANFYLSDTVIARGLDGQRVGMQGSVTVNANVRIQSGPAPVVRLDNLGVQIANTGAGFNTSIDVPVGTQVVVGKATTQDGKSRTLILVVSAKILD